jgi:hypothetical protein
MTTVGRIEALTDHIDRMLKVEGDAIIHGLVVAELAARWIVAADPIGTDGERLLQLHTKAVRALVHEMNGGGPYFTVVKGGKSP